MPIYEFQCTECKNIDEVFMQFSDAPPTECSKCNKPVQKILSQTSFALKGSGWYASDYKGGSNTAPAVKESSQPAAVKPAETKPSETKSAETKTVSAPTSSTPKPSESK